MKPKHITTLLFFLLSITAFTPAQMYDEQGELVWEMDLDIYGRVRNFAGRSLNECPFRFQGQYFDVETGLAYNRFRYYDPEVGNYISQDPIRLTGGTRLYGYVINTNAEIDLFGLLWTKTDVSGRTIYQNDGLFDINTKSTWKDSNGNWKRGTNLERMSDGHAPIGIDGKSMQLHHLTQTEVNGLTSTRGSLAEVTATQHSKYSKQLHMPVCRNPNNPSHTIPQYPSFRRNNDGSFSKLHGEFEDYKKDYWQERAKQLAEKNH